MLWNRTRLVQHLFASPVYAPQSAAVFAVQSPQMSTAFKGYYDTFIRTLVNTGIWDQLFLLSVVDPNGSIINLRNPTVACTVTGSPTVTPNRGVTGNGGATDGYTTGYTQTAILQDDISYGVFSVSDDAATGSAGAAIGLSASSRMFPSSNRTLLTRLNTNAGGSVSRSVTNSIGLKMASRGSSSTVDLTDGQNEYNGIASVSTGTSTGSITVCYVSSSVYLGQVFAGIAGRYLSPELRQILNTALQSFALNVGATYTARIVGAEPAGTATSATALFYNGSVPLSGTVIASALTLQYKITEAVSGNTVVDWTTLVTPISTGPFNVTVTGVPQTGYTQPYKVEYRFSDLSFATARSSTNFYCGEIIELDGESLQNQSYSVVDAPGTSDAGALRMSNGLYGGALPMDSPLVSGEYGASGPFGGDASILWGNILRAGLGKPILGLQFARGGTTLDVWIREEFGGLAEPTQGYFNYGARAAGSLTAQQAAPGVNIGGTCLRTGINNAIAGTTGAQMTALLQAYVADKRNLHGSSTYPIFISPVGRAFTNSFTDEELNDIRQAMFAFLDDNVGNNIYHGGTSLTLTLIDAYHLDTNGRKQFDVLQARAIEAVKGTEPYGADGPKIASIAAAAAGNTIDITCTQNGGTALWDASNNPAGTGLTGFRAFVGGVERTITAAVIQSANVVRLTVDGAAFTAGNVVGIDYQYGKVTAAQIVNPVFDNDVPTSSLGGQGIPLQPSRRRVEVTVT